MSDPSTSAPFVVTKDLSEGYYKGLPSQPPLIATTKPGPFDAPTGLEAYSVLKELRCLGDHPLATVWDQGLAAKLCRSLTAMGVKWSCIDALRIANIGEPSGPPIIWIGVEFGTLNFEKGSGVAISCHKLIEDYGIHDYYVEIRESYVMREVGNRLLDLVPLSDPTFTARDPYTGTLGIPIATKNRPRTEGTGGFYLSAGGNDKNIYLATARHVILPVDKGNNKEYCYSNDSMPQEDVMILGTSFFDRRLEAIDYEIQEHYSAIAHAHGRMELVRGKHDPKLVKEFNKAETEAEEAEEGLEALRVLRQEISTHWMAKEKRVFGTLIWAPPITLSTEPGQYTLDLAIIKINTGILDANNYYGNAINIGKKYSRKQFMDKVYLDPTSSHSFKFPPNLLVKLTGQVPVSDLQNPPMLDANGEPCLVVIKNGAMTGTTIGRANNVSSYTRTCFVGEYMESREWPVIATDNHSGPFSSPGDSGSCVADAFSRIGGILTGGSGSTPSSDITYVTPITFIMKTLHDSRLFKRAHLNPALT
ncbi:hypothetical protein HOY80DRAFT_113258 [Tuber brumale]|nr:hypothetical protein HOY80DRAFT_113258 [Tuber brumale]